MFTDPTHVIGLYPDLLPADYRKQLHYPNPLPTLSGAELEKAHLALIDYLTQVCICLFQIMKNYDLLPVYCHDSILALPTTCVPTTHYPLPVSCHASMLALLYINNSLLM